MDSERLKVLLSAIETGSLSDAAEMLGYTPSGVSRMMATLEEELGIPLLIRSRNGVTPTKDCELLIPEVREVIRSTEHLQQRAAEIQGVITGNVRVATAYSVYYKELSEIIRAFGKKYPGIKVGIKEDTSSRLLEEIEIGELDFVIISEREGRCEWIPLLDDDLKAWVPADHPLAKKKSYPLKRVEEDPFIQLYDGMETDSSRVCEQYGVHPNKKYASSDTFAAYAMVDAGIGVTLTNALFDDLWTGSVKSLPLEPRVRIPIGIAVTESERISPAAKRFRDFALTWLRDEKRG